MVILLQEFWIVESPDEVSPSEPIREGNQDFTIYFPVIRYDEYDETVTIDERVEAIQDMYLLLWYEDNVGQSEDATEIILESYTNVVPDDAIIPSNARFVEEYGFHLTPPVIYHCYDARMYMQEEECVDLGDLSVESKFHLYTDPQISQRNIQIILGVLSKGRYGN